MLIPTLKCVFTNEKEIIDKDFNNDVEIDKEYTEEFAQRNHRGSIRISEGLFYNKSEYEKWRTDILTSELP
jgi:hypothetical protein